jgi:hypothetical protein
VAGEKSGRYQADPLTSFRESVGLGVSATKSGPEWLEAEFIAGWIQPLSIWQTTDWQKGR